VDARVLPGKTVRAGASKTPGVIGIKPTHLCEDGEQENALPVKALYIDIGAGSRDEALAAVAPGDPIYFTCEQLEQGGFLRAKALDDRVGCCVLLAMLARPQPVDCAYAFTAQEEVGARGAHTAAYAAEPDIAVIVEGTTAADLPGAGAKKVCVPGKGAVLPFMDKGTFYDRELFAALRRLAGERGIPWQAKEYVSGGTDASAAQRSRSGVRAACIAAAVRYIHSPASAMCLADLEHILGLAEAALAHFGGGEYV
jgi:endoglucanase